MLPMLSAVLLRQVEAMPPSSADTGMSIVTMLILGAIVFLQLAGMWLTFTKAGQPGWAAIIPIFNLFILMRVAGRPGWWVLLAIIPIVNIITMIVVSIGVSKNFGKGAGFGLGLALLGFIFYPILGFGDAQYQPVASG
jgi:hypothetical protein